MLKRTMAVGLALALALTAGSAAAQQCSIGAYADRDGTVGLFQPTEVQAFPVYVVLFSEDTINAAAYDIEFPDENSTLFVSGITYGPNASGINVITPGGNNVGLGECAIGFTGLPVVVTCYDVLVTAANPGGSINVLPNPDVDGDVTRPQYATCQGLVKPCDVGPSLTIEPPIATRSESFGAVKSLY